MSVSLPNTEWDGTGNPIRPLEITLSLPRVKKIEPTTDKKMLDSVIQAIVSSDLKYFDLKVFVCGRLSEEMSPRARVFQVKDGVMLVSSRYAVPIGQLIKKFDCVNWITFIKYPQQ